jgi:8-hydroxy-5-deazaflavin:NADPH oxidoreductase
MSAAESRPIAILGGTGPAGMGLALRWVRAGETVILGSRDAQRAQEAAEKIKQRTGSEARVSGMENSAACRAAEILVLTVPFEGQASLLKQLKPAIRPGSILIDATVALAASVGGRASRTLGVWQGSAAQQAAELVPQGVSVAAAFHNLSAGLLNGDEPLDCDVIVCGDDANANQIARALAAKISGVRAIDGGKLENARVLEQITALLIGLNIRHKGHGGIRITGLPPEAYR